MTTRRAALVALGAIPSTREEFEALRKMPRHTLLELGLHRWSADEGAGTLWLFPAQWYERIPEGLMVQTITGERIRFIPGRTDDESRSGALAYGLWVPKK